ncbi:killer cell lectin-like receptor 5 [Mus pahari]|uniref:killer cell lectin-like receptor 5 n=1 Tax=Mus pahari TaxID=10093 RepID=UPI000A30DFEE|nr:killer cell lectin-like receptor 5 [Mus pahari]
MSEQEVTYSTVRFHKSLGLQNQVRPEETQGSREAGKRECSVPWHLIVIAFGILCALLLVIVAVLVTNIFQYNQEKHELQKTLNCQHNCSTMQSDINLKEEMLRNMTLECSTGNDLLKSLNREQKRWYSETKTVLDSSQHTGGRMEIHWFCYGIKCYYFIMDKKRWRGCKQTCKDYSSSLLKIDTEDELKLLQFQVTPGSYWIGLSYDNKKKDWAWIDNGPSKLDLKIRKFNCKLGRCAFLTRARLEDTSCESSYPCICEKRQNKFPD